MLPGKEGNGAGQAQKSHTTTGRKTVKGQYDMEIGGREEQAGARTTETITTEKDRGRETRKAV